MIKTHELTDAEWAILEPVMPSHPVQGHRWNDHRTEINGIVWRIRTGTPWRDVPERYGNWKSVYGRHRCWSSDGTWQRIAEALRVDVAGGCRHQRVVGYDGWHRFLQCSGASARRGGPGVLDSGLSGGLLDNGR